MDISDMSLEDRIEAANRELAADLARQGLSAGDADAIDAADIVAEKYGLQAQLRYEFVAAPQADATPAP